MKCPKCGQTVWESAIDRAKGNCFYCSGAPEVKINEVVKRKVNGPEAEDEGTLPGETPVRVEKEFRIGRNRAA